MWRGVEGFVENRVLSLNRNVLEGLVDENVINFRLSFPTMLVECWLFDWDDFLQFVFIDKFMRYFALEQILKNVLKEDLVGL